MNKKPLIITFVSLFIAFAIIGVAFYLQTFKTVHFDIKKENIKVTVYKGTDAVTSFNSDTDIRLQKGDYSFTTEGSDYTNTPIGFTVVDDWRRRHLRRWHMVRHDLNPEASKC
jgi:hypothetical protein